VDYGALLDEAFDDVDDNYRDHWAYTETMKTSDGVFVARFDPSLARGKRWTLATVDGRKPKAKETKEFLKEKGKEEERSGEDESSGVDSMISDRAGLRLINETEEYWLLSFRPKAEGDQKKVMKHLNGRLKIRKEDRSIEFIKMSNQKPFKPSFTTKIYNFYMQYDFGRIGDDGPLLPRSLDFKIELKAVGVVKVNEKVTAQYSDYEKVGD
jgi:hypothetical protein